MLRAAQASGDPLNMTEQPQAGPAGLLRLTAFEVDRAPAQPGIYAWYVATPFSPHDWKPTIEGGVDRNTEFFLGALMRYASYFGPEVLTLQARANYSARWSGELTGPDMRKDSDETVRLRETAEQIEQRHVAVSLLCAAVPHFAAPAYIGVTVDLRDRLAQHLNDYERAREALRRNPDRAGELHRKGKNLGARLAGASVPLEHLSVSVLPTDLPDTAPDTARRAAETTEWFLQRVFQPAFGRR